MHLPARRDSSPLRAGYSRHRARGRTIPSSPSPRRLEEPARDPAVLPLASARGRDCGGLAALHPDCHRDRPGHCRRDWRRGCRCCCGAVHPGHGRADVDAFRDHRPAVARLRPPDFLRASGARPAAARFVGPRREAAHRNLHHSHPVGRHSLSRRFHRSHRAHCVPDGRVVLHARGARCARLAPAVHTGRRHWARDACWPHLRRHHRRCLHHRRRGTDWAPPHHHQR
jgi:hypothetical protein